MERFGMDYVYPWADLYWEWGTSLRRRTSELYLQACNAHALPVVMVSASGRVEIEGAYR